MAGIKQGIVLLAVFFAGFPLAGCGKKTPPVPPAVVIPVAVDDLRYDYNLENVSLFWSYPDKSISGRVLDDVGYFMLYQSEVAEEEYCSGCPVDFKPKLKIDAAILSPGKEMKIREADFRAGHYYTYMVKSHSGWNIVSEESNKVSFWWAPPAPAPSGVKLQVGDRKLHLNWQPVASYAGGEAIAWPMQYQVYRRTEDKRFSAVGAPLLQTSFVDENVQNDREYFYQVQTQHVYHETVVPGEYSKTISAVPSDITPPPVPQLLSSVMVSDGVKILWDSVMATDLAGYVIYRRTDGSPWVKVGQTSAGAFSFVDRSIPQDQDIWYYSITSFDRETPPNESSFAREVSVKK
ncbi:MAG: fibronectin type III domain-containing protein [Desulfobulbaceae bacterium]|uniref:Fibronectin type III domain-containing protein n=1 Tax=Candidatus Desulfobia pelagia TaxID=2841692 RepID=A0A8J6NCN4_9BACT|nr:fibronectin type III domain-containing protein [Candidatus Desulfobia pelagia]